MPRWQRCSLGVVRDDGAMTCWHTQIVDSARLLTGLNADQSLVRKPNREESDWRAFYLVTFSAGSLHSIAGRGAALLERLLA